MGQLNPNIAVVDLVLTDRGRQLLAEGSPDFNIVKWSVADDEVDYSLFDTSQASSDLYGQFIKSMPVFEASTFSAHAMRYKLVTLPAGSTKVPILKVEPTSMGNVNENQEIIITPSIINFTLSPEQQSFTAVLRNSNLGTLSVHEGVQGGGVNAPSELSIDEAGVGIGSAFVSTDQTERVQTAVGKSFKFRAAEDVSNIDSNARSTVIEIFGNVVGGAQSIALTVIHATGTNSGMLL